MVVDLGARKIGQSYQIWLPIWLGEPPGVHLPWIIPFLDGEISPGPSFKGFCKGWNLDIWRWGKPEPVQRRSPIPLDIASSQCFSSPSTCTAQNFSLPLSEPWALESVSLVDLVFDARMNVNHSESHLNLESSLKYFDRWWPADFFYSPQLSKNSCKTPDFS